jgi:hypothetical protein
MYIYKSINFILRILREKDRRAVYRAVVEKTQVP